jgi:Fic family protein
MRDLERFINDPTVFAVDPLIKMALIHHQFESIHPFYDGNGRTGRILNVLYLVKEGLARHSGAVPEQPHRAHQGRLLPPAADRARDDTWEDWVLYMLDAVEQTAGQTMATIHAIKTALFDYKHRIRAGYKFYSQDLINNLFMHPYTKIEFVQRDLQGVAPDGDQVHGCLAEGGFVQKQKGRAQQLLHQRHSDEPAEMNEDQLEQKIPVRT